MDNSSRYLHTTAANSSIYPSHYVTEHLTKQEQSKKINDKILRGTSPKFGECGSRKMKEKQ
jgi:hypothetical protein